MDIVGVGTGEASVCSIGDLGGLPMGLARYGASEQAEERNFVGTVLTPQQNDRNTLETRCRRSGARSKAITGAVSNESLRFIHRALGADGPSAEETTISGVHTDRATLSLRPLSLVPIISRPCFSRNAHEMDLCLYGSNRLLKMHRVQSCDTARL